MFDSIGDWLDNVINDIWDYTGADSWFSESVEYGGFGDDWFTGGGDAYAWGGSQDWSWVPDYDFGLDTFPESDWGDLKKPLPLDANAPELSGPFKDGPKAGPFGGAGKAASGTMNPLGKLLGTAAGTIGEALTNTGTGSGSSAHIHSTTSIAPPSNPSVQSRRRGEGSPAAVVMARNPLFPYTQALLGNR